MTRSLAFLLIVPAAAFAQQERSESRELVGQLGSRTVYAVLHSTQRSDTSWRVTGEYLILPTLARRFVDGDRSPERGFTSLKESASAILFGQPATGELRGTYRGGVFKGVRYGPGGQERERFEFSEEFPSMDGYSATVSCEAGDARYASNLAYTVESGKVKSIDWSSRVTPAGHGCKVSGDQVAFKGGLRAAAGNCTITLRDLGEAILVSAQNCASACGSQGYLESLLIDRRGSCRLLRPEAR